MDELDNIKSVTTTKTDEGSEIQIQLDQVKMSLAKARESRGNAIAHANELQYDLDCFQT